jgi:hypothetical protein
MPTPWNKHRIIANTLSPFGRSGEVAVAVIAGVDGGFPDLADGAAGCSFQAIARPVNDPTARPALQQGAEVPPFPGSS